MPFEHPPDAWRPERRFEDLVRRILEANGFRVERGPEQRFDFLARRDDRLFAVEVKYYRTAAAQIGLLEAAAAQLLAAARSSSARAALLVTSAVLPATARDVLEDRLHLVVYDRDVLAAMAARAPELLDDLRSVLETDVLRDDDRPASRVEAAFRFDALPTFSPPPPNVGAQLCAKLQALPTGRAGWRSYEKLCFDVLQYLFGVDLYGWRMQKQTEDGFDRYDCVCRINSTKAFWRFLVDQLNSRYVIFEFKNYARTIKQGQVLTTEKYLLERGLRRVAIMLTRKGADAGALRTAAGAMREQGKLFVILDDAAVCSMLATRDNGGDPTDFLFDRVDDFLMSLPR